VIARVVAAGTGARFGIWVATWVVAAKTTAMDDGALPHERPRLAEVSSFAYVRMSHQITGWSDHRPVSPLSAHRPRGVPVARPIGQTTGIERPVR
jgi:hypothetical protein